MEPTSRDSGPRTPEERKGRMWLLHCYVRRQKSQQNKKHKKHKKTALYPAPRVLQCRSFCLKIPPKFFSFLSFTTFRFYLFHLLFSVSGKGWLVFSCGLMNPSLFFPYLFSLFLFLFCDLYLISCPSSLFISNLVPVSCKEEYDAFPFLQLPCNQSYCILPLI